jgi:hypothetical protein
MVRIALLGKFAIGFITAFISGIHVLDIGLHASAGSVPFLAKSCGQSFSAWYASSWGRVRASCAPLFAASG